VPGAPAPWYALAVAASAARRAAGVIKRRSAHPLVNVDQSEGSDLCTIRSMRVQRWQHLKTYQQGGRV